MKRLALFLLFLLCPCLCLAEWEYSEKVDKMRSQTTSYAHVKSTNKLIFDFPYQGGSAGEIILRRGSNLGNSVMLRIDKGQFMCSFSGCSVAAKFDNEKIERYEADHPADGSSEVLFLKPYDRFVQKLRKAKNLTIEVQFFREGLRQLEFDVSGLVWK